jgi:hypothetical protein
VKLGNTEKDVDSLDVENVLLVSVGRQESHQARGDINAERVASLPKEKGGRLATSTKGRWKSWQLPK